MSDIKRLDELVELSRKDFHCDNLQCCEYEDYHQCFTHAHVLCPQYEEYQARKSEKEKNKKI